MLIALGARPGRLSYKADVEKEGIGIIKEFYRADASKSSFAMIKFE